MADNYITDVTYFGRTFLIFDESHSTLAVGLVFPLALKEYNSKNFYHYDTRKQYVQSRVYKLLV